MTANELLAYLLNETLHPLAAPLAVWLERSPRFAAFATTYRDKIRKKIKQVGDDESARDLLLELETAYLLLQERKLSLAYEPYSAHKTRGPDFAVTLTSGFVFHVEVTRMRRTASDEQQQTIKDAANAQLPVEAEVSSSTLRPRPSANDRLGEMVCSKLGQMQAGTPNVLVVFIHSSTLSQIDIAKAMALIKQRAEQRDQRLFAWYAFRTPADFFRQYERLSAVVLRTAWDDQAPATPIVWNNRQAKHRLPDRIQNLLRQP